MKKEYRIQKGWAIFIYIGTPIVVASGLAFISLPFLIHPFQWILSVLFIPMGLGIIAIYIHGMWGMKFASLIIDNEKVYTNINRIGLYFNEIKGFRYNNGHITIVPIDSTKKSIGISQYSSGVKDIHNWLSERYPNLDIIEHQQEINQILQDSSLGRFEEERMDKLQYSRRISWFVNITSFILFSIGFIWPNPSVFVIIGLICTFLLSCLAYRIVPLLSIFESKTSGYSSITAGLFMSGGMLTLRAFLDYSLLDIKNLWIPSAFLVALIISIYVIGNKEIHEKSKKSLPFAILTVLLLSGIFPYGAIVEINCMNDHSKPRIFSAKVLEKRMEAHAVLFTYHLKLTSWGTLGQDNSTNVPYETFDQVNVGDNINVNVYEGRLGIPWYEVRTMEK